MTKVSVNIEQQQQQQSCGHRLGAFFDSLWIPLMGTNSSGSQMLWSRSVLGDGIAGGVCGVRIRDGVSGTREL